ncbi:Z-ring formation inhibitor MciZ [Brevibacillus laterosporus]|uniref:Z-ring formation inhibitor MciZ n=1 Tax=Brevibacillus halotolerans TaxID=1507437 RepID=A0ABT4HWE1_9BACL|nr:MULTISPECIES: Z-ring formation inhibitor MciZ [Brevibacillus]MCR8985169.1 Z-ring formation inhibitor MciZ [Brevibacillus laterosporus]MCZ0830898.1 Z-ring formation inhibitor MciZ [Brevibacillus halotolerans]
MKLYTDLKQLRLIGKVNEIQAALRGLSEQPITLHHYLQQINQPKV